MKRTLLFFAGFLLIITTITLHSQQYYNYNTAGTANSFPFNIATGKEVQLLYLPGDFNQPTPAPSGNITKLYFKMNDALGPWTYTNFVIKMGQAASFTTFAAGTWYTGPMITVYDSASVSLSASAGGWLQIQLEVPFAYDNTQSLIVEVQQCGVTGATGFSTAYTTLANTRRNAGPLTATTCPLPWGNQGGQTHHIGFDIAPPVQAPDYLYYKFENNPTPTSVLNCAIPGVGTPTAPITGVTLTPGGQFDSCITGAAATSSGVTTGFNWNLGGSSWTISMWLTIPTTSVIGYIFGDPGSNSFRCFHNGVAGADNILVRFSSGGGAGDVLISGVGPNPTAVAIVYDSASGQVKAYKNGVLSNTVSFVVNLPTGTGFKVGGYSTSANLTGKLDEFRLYKRPLDAAEVLATWNQDIACGQLVPVTGNNNQIPKEYLLEQNYPNPFNPVTNINFSIPKTGFTEVKVFDALGREVAVLYSSYTTAGSYSVKFDAASLSSGVYFYTIKSGEFTATKKMALIK